MATTPTLPLFDEPATPSQRPSPDGSSISTAEPYSIARYETQEEYTRRTRAEGRGTASDEERQAHVDALRAEGKLAFGDPVADMRKPWWETLTETSANEALARYEREAQQSQSLAADLDPFEEYPFDD